MLQQLRERLDGVSSGIRRVEDLNLPGEVSSDGYIQFKKPKKKKALRRRKDNKLDTDALEAGAISGVDDDDLDKSLDRARKIALKKKEEDGAEAVARLAAAAAATNQTVDEHDSESQGIVETGTKQFVIGLQLGKAADVLMEEDDEPIVSDEEGSKDEPSGPIDTEENSCSNEQEDEIVADEIIREVTVGKGLAIALKLCQERGSLKETVNGGGRNMDKKKSKLVGVVNDDEHDDEPPKKTRQRTHRKDSKDFIYHEKDIRIERTDEFGRSMTKKEEFRSLCHKFHGKGPGKKKQAKRMKQYQEEVKRQR